MGERFEDLIDEGFSFLLKGEGGLVILLFPNGLNHFNHIFILYSFINSNEREEGE
jgi:hypothetical protein